MENDKVITFKYFRTHMSKILAEAGDKSVHFTRLGEHYEVKKVSTSEDSNKSEHNKEVDTLDHVEDYSKVAKVKKAVKEIQEHYKAKDPEEVVEEYVKFEPAYASRGFSEYGCGCEKEDKKFLCSKHGRM